MEFVASEEGPENIWIASADGDIERVKELIESGTPVNVQDEYGHTPIHAASSYGHIDLLRYLLSVGADINIRDFDGDTPLLVSELPEVFEFLRAAGADAAAINNDQMDILKKCVEDENEDMIKYLIENGFVNDPHFKFTPGMFEINMSENDAYTIEEGENEEEGEGEAEDAEKMDS